jgi:hypothetical protein
MIHVTKIIANLTCSNRIPVPNKTVVSHVFAKPKTSSEQNSGLTRAHFKNRIPVSNKTVVSDVSASDIQKKYHTVGKKL